MLVFKREDIIIQPKTHKFTVVFLPGWSRSAKLDQNVLKTVPFLENTRIRIVQPPHRKALRYSERTFPSWFLIDLEVWGSLMPGLNEISRLVDEILQEEFEMCENLFLAGFSQGGVTSIYTGLVTCKLPLLGIIALSCFVPLANWKDERKSIPLFIYHGEKDEIVNQKTNQMMVQNSLSEFNLTYLTDPQLGHTYSWKEFEQLKEWMKRVINRERI
jgi:phospholipase/carboxylesterase